MSLQRTISRYFLITITLLAGCGTLLRAQQMTTQAPPTTAVPDGPDQLAFPTARVVPPVQAPDAVEIESKVQSVAGGVFILDKDVVITYRDRRVEADHVEYDSNTGEVTLTGRVVVTGATRHYRIAASHGSYNLKTETGRFYDVDGSFGQGALANRNSAAARRAVYTNDSPFLFTGRIVVKRGDDVFDVYDGTVTSCQRPKPDWILSAAHISVDGETASAHNATFRLVNIPLLFLPYVTHPATSEQRQSGFMVPTVGLSNQKGFIVGEQIYFAINRSLDLTVGANYYSQIGFAQNATMRYRGAGLDFGTFHYSGVLDRRSGSLNQGGEEVLLLGRHDLSAATRAVADIDYLSSYIYREAFSDTFNQAVTSDILSTAYVTHQRRGFELGLLADRYQGIKLIAVGSSPQQQVRLFHAPTLSLFATDHVVPHTGNAFSAGLQLSLESTASGLKRSQPNFTTGGIIERFDLHPQASYPLALGDLHVVPSFAVRETVYSRSRATVPAGAPPAQSANTLLRSDYEFTLAVRPPVLSRTFQPSRLRGLLGDEVRHTIEPQLTYRLVDGVNQFGKILRFDADDVVSNTDEAEYGVTQRVFRRNTHTAGEPCRSEDLRLSPGFNSDAPNTPDEMRADEPTPANQPASAGCPSEELISWRLTQKYFFDQTFGKAIGNGRRNIFTSTLDLSGVSFLTEPREVSPLISRLRVRTSAHTDVEWDFDLDTGAKKFNASNVYLDLHQGNGFAAISYARLDAPGRFYTENPTPTPGKASTDGVNSATSDFNQLRVLVGFGNPVKRGLSIAANSGIDLKALYGASSARTTTKGGVTTTDTFTVYPPLLQYATVQASYNWNCCGLAIEYRKLELGSVRNDGTYRFNFTLANIGAAGNLRRAERLF